MVHNTYRLLTLAALLLTFLAASCDTTPKPGMALGKELYETCLPCHGPNGGGNQALAAPAIAGQSRWYVADQLKKFQGGLRGTHPDDTEGHRMRPMARTLYKDGDVESVAEYVASLPRVAPDRTLRGGDPARGQTQFAVCIACHGANAEGNEGLRAPSLVDKPDWYMVAQLKKYKSGMRGAHPEDTFGATMRAIASTLEDEQAMIDVVAYIQSLAR